VNDIALTQGDGLKVAATSSLLVSGARKAEVLVFDLPGARQAVR
jgi:hypothetical protein